MWLHDYSPTAILVSFGPLTIYWYGIFTVLGVVAAMLVSIRSCRIYGISKEEMIDLAFWLIIGGLIGARTYHILLELPYYWNNPIDILKIWQGGLAIHGAIFAGMIVIWFFAKKDLARSFILASLITPGLAIGQAIGRWGNYFNQELFGLPTDLPWGIPIGLPNRPEKYFNSEYFHPTFLYESLGNLAIFVILISAIKYFHKRRPQLLPYVFIIYIILYSILRFGLEFIRVDRTPEIGFWRWPQLISLVLISIATFFSYRQAKNRPELLK